MNARSTWMHRVMCVLALASAGAPVEARTQARRASAAATPPVTAVAAPAPSAGAVVPAGYVIGPDDVLSILFWREKDLSGDVAVRPDGKISLPLLNDIQAAGLTPDQLRSAVAEQAARFVEEPTVTVVVKQINSRKVFITGQVARPGSYPLVAPTTVLQLIAMAGGVLEYADAKNISIMRTEQGRPLSFRFNYSDVAKRKNLRQNIELKPGDTIVVP